GRCVWCGVSLSDSAVRETLEHIAPKHMGDDMQDASNWAISCDSCNAGKGDSLAWAASAWAHDYVTRGSREGVLTRQHRWAVLMRSKECSFCRARPENAELWVFRRIR